MTKRLILIALGFFVYGAYEIGNYAFRLGKTITPEEFYRYQSNIYQSFLVLSVLLLVVFLYKIARLNKTTK